MWLFNWSKTEDLPADMCARIERFREARRCVPSKSISCMHTNLAEYTRRMTRIQQLFAQRGGSSSSTSGSARGGARARRGNAISCWRGLYSPPATFDSAYEAVTAPKAASFRARQFDHVSAGWRQREEADMRWEPVPKDKCLAALQTTFGSLDLSNMIPMRFILTFNNYDLALNAVETLVHEFDTRDTMVESLTDRLFGTDHGAHGCRPPMVVLNVRIYGVLWSVEICVKQPQGDGDVTSDEELVEDPLLHYEVYRLALASSLHLLPEGYKGDPSFHKDASGSTALHHMVLRNDHQAVKHLLHLGADPWEMDADGRPPLFYAMLLEHEKCATHLQHPMEATKSHAITSPHACAPVWGLIEFYNDLPHAMIPDAFAAAYEERILELCSQRDYNEIRHFLQFGVPLKLDDPHLRGLIRTLFIGGDHREAFTIMAILSDDTDVDLSHLALSAEMLTDGLLYVLSPKMFFGFRKLSLAHACIGSRESVTKTAQSPQKQPASVSDVTGDAVVSDLSPYSTKYVLPDTITRGGELRLNSLAALATSRANHTSFDPSRQLLDALCVWLHVCPRLSKLDLTGCNLTVSHIKLLSKQFPHEEVTLKYLNLNENRFGAQKRAGVFLYRLISRLQSLIYIGMADIGASDKFMTEFYTSHSSDKCSTILPPESLEGENRDAVKTPAVSFHPRAAPAFSTASGPVSLQNLTMDLSWNPNLLRQSSAKMHLAHLLCQCRHIKLEGVGLQNSGLLELLCGLDGTEALQSLHVNYNTFTSPGAADSLSAACRAEFTEMKLMACSITGDAIDGIDVKSCALQSLNLSWNRKFGKQGAGYMGLARFQQLKHLYLAYCNLTEAFVVNFSEHLSEVSALEKLILTGNPGICSSTEAGAAMASILNKALIESLSWADCQVAPPFLRAVRLGDQTRTVTHLDVSGNTAIGQSECYALLLDAISVLPLQALYANECALNADGLQQLPPHIKAVAKLYLDGNPGVGSQNGAMAIKRLFGAPSQALKFVSVRNCDLPAGAEDLFLKIETKGGKVDYRRNPAWRK